MKSGERKQLLDTERPPACGPTDSPAHAENEDIWWPRVLKIAGYICCIAGVLLSAVSYASVQAMGTIVPGFELNAWRYVVQFLVVSPILGLKRQDVRIPRGTIPYMCLVCVVYSAVGFCLYESAKYLPMGEAGCLLPSLILILTSFVSTILTRHCKIYILVSIVLCLAGSVLYAQPDFLFGGDNTDQAMHPLCGDTQQQIRGNENNTTWTHSNSTGYSNIVFVVTDEPLNSSSTSSNIYMHDLVLGYAYLVGTSISYTVVIFLTGRTLKDVSPFVTSFWVGLSATIISLLLMAILETPVFPSKAHCQGLLMSHALSAGLSQSLQLGGMALLPPTIYALVLTLLTVFYCLAQYTVLRDISPARGNALEVAGAAIVLLGNVVGPFYRMYEDAKEKPVGRQELQELPLENRDVSASQPQSDD